MIFRFNFVSSFLIQQEMPTVMYFVNNSSCFRGGGVNLSAISKVNKTIFKKDCPREIVLDRNKPLNVLNARSDNS